MDGAQWLRQCQLDRVEYQQKADQEKQLQQQLQQQEQQAKQPRPPMQINALKHRNMQKIMARAAAEDIRVEAEAEVGDVSDRNTRCRSSPWRQFRNGRQIVYYPSPELHLSPHRAAHLRLRMLQQEQHLFVSASPLSESTSTSITTTARRSVRTLLAAAVVEATATVAATATTTLASVEQGQRYGPTEWRSLSRSGTLPGRSPSAIQEQGDRLCTPGSSRGGNNKKKRVCRFPGCTRVIKSQGHCQRHGAKAKRCKVDGCDKQAQGTHQGMCKRHWRELTCKGNMKRNNIQVSDGVATGLKKQNTAWIDPKNRKEPSATTRAPLDPITSNSTSTMTTTTTAAIITEDSSHTTVPIKEEEQEDADDYRQQQQQQQMGNTRTHGDEECDNTDGWFDRDTKEFGSRPTNVKVEDHNDEERLWTTFFQEEGDVDDDDNDDDDETRRDEHPDNNTVTEATRTTATAVMPTILFHQEAITDGGEEIVF